MQKFCAVLGFLLLFVLGNVTCQKYETDPLFKKVQKTWKQRDYRQLQRLLAKRVKLNLGSIQGKYQRAHIVGILKKYFRQIRVVKYEYIPKRLERSRAVVDYHYTNVSNSLVHKKFLYIYLTKENGTWVISKITVV